MTRLIAEILDIPQVSLALLVQELEGLSGKPGTDIRLANELDSLFKEKAVLLGLDGNDTTPKELYYAMRAHALEDSDKLARIIGITAEDSPEKMTEKSISFVEKRIGKKSVWALKPSIARKQLKENPPKRLMKIFNIRSIDSALKRDRLSVFYCFAGRTEPPVWIKKYAEQASKLTNSDFNSLNLSIKIVERKRQGQLKKAEIKLNQMVFSDQESASIEICVAEKRFSGDVLFVVDSLINHIKHLLRNSEYYKTQALRPDFFKKLERVRMEGFHSLELDDYPFDWTTIVHAAAEKGITGLLQAEEAVTTSENLIIPSLAQISGFDFWKHPFGMHAERGAIISFNLSDMIVNAINERTLEEAYVGHGRSHLRRELFSRYLHHGPLREKINLEKEAGV